MSISRIDLPSLAEACHIQHLATNHPIAWWQSSQPVAYDHALALMTAHTAAIRTGQASQAIWLLEHQPVYTGGRSSVASDMRVATSTPIRHTNRGGQWTYHAPGQRVVYIMLDVLNYGGDVREFVRGIEGWGIAALAQFGVTGSRRQGLPGIWVGGDKIIAIGIRLTRWVSWHGMVINVHPEVLAGFQSIVPCGVRDGGVACLADLANTSKNTPPLMQQLDSALMASFAESIGGLASHR